MRNIKLTIAYDGSSFFGFQIQPGIPTIQGTIESALSQVMKEDIRIIGSGRTDAGVHAINQVINFTTNSFIPVEKIPIAMNSIITPSIVVKDAEEVSLDFNARLSARSRTYIYVIYSAKEPSPFLKNYAWYLKKKPEIEVMRNALPIFIGKHDFTGFSKSDGEGTIREVYRIDFLERGSFLLFYIKANAFLRGMVRLIVKALVDVGNREIGPERLKYILESKERGLVKGIAPPYGLYLYKVEY
ncbi:MAG: tRNA pseudouridine(38-40) synthase TruA [bacterium]